MKKVEIKNIRNIGMLSFELPPPGLHVLTGKNGTGKTTLFTCISRICNNNAYRLGFPSSSSGTLDVFSGTIKYTVDDSSVAYSKRLSGEWRPDKKNSSVLEKFCYPQVVNITTKNERLFSQDVISPRKRMGSDFWLNEKLNIIFDTTKFTSMIRITTGDLRSGRGTSADDKRRNTAYAIPLGHNKHYTEQNFSFGEIVMINLLYDVKNVINGSFVLIDELELALHPSAQIRLLSCLRDIAQEKGLTILISTHSSSIIKAQKSVILLEEEPGNVINTFYGCPPAKAIGAIGMREDTNPDIIILVEDNMAKSLFYALKQRYIELQNEVSYLDVRILEIGGFQNVIHFYIEANNYIFYDNIYVAAFMDKDVETDIIPYPQFVYQNLIKQYKDNASYLHFLPYTPEVLLVKTFYNHKTDLLRQLSTIYGNQQLQYNTTVMLDFDEYESPLPIFLNNNEYSKHIELRGAFRKKCKNECERIAQALADQINLSIDEIFRFTFKFALDNIGESELNVRALLAPTLKRLRR